jgi:HD superfamily phosphohydrolase
VEDRVKIPRVRDPIHDLITFDPHDDRDRLAWRLINTREFQRLRRIRQLGFSELVFPGATHTRFSHCLGAFSIARKLLEIIRKKLGTSYNERKAYVAAIAALVHDLGHGPFSHVFEGVQKDLGESRSHEDWTREIIEADSEIHKLLNEHDSTLASEVAAGKIRRTSTMP